jgi:methyl-accepting chemotaxis protein
MKETETSVGFGLYPKIFLSVLAIALIPLAVIGWSDYNSAKEESGKRVNRQFQQDARLVDATVVGWVDTNVRGLDAAARLADMRSMNAARQQPALKVVVDAYDWTFLASTIGSDGMNVARSDISKLNNYADRTYFKDAMAGNVGHEVVISRTNNQPALVLSVPIRMETGATAVLMTSSSLINIADEISAMKFGRTGFAFLLDEQGRVVAHPTPNITGKLIDMSTHPAYLEAKKNAQGFVNFSEGDKNFVAFARTTKFGWIVVVQQDAAEAFAPVHEAVKSVTNVFESTALLAVGLAFALARGMAKPIIRLTRIAEKVSRGETEVTIADVARTDEIGGLARAMERMRVSIDMAIARLRKLDRPTQFGT